MSGYNMLKSQYLNRQIRSASKRLSSLLKRPIVWIPPQHIAIEITNTCNLRCPMCKMGQRNLGRKIGSMEYNNYCKLIDEVSPYIKSISFPWYGEPFTHKDFYLFVEYASKKELEIRIQTNGTYLNKCKLDYLIGCNVKLITVAIDGLDQETYEKYRVGGNLADIVAGVERLVELRRKKRSNFPKCIQMNFIVMKHNEHQLPHIEEFSRKIGFDNIKIKTVHVDRNEDGKKYLPTDDKYIRYKEDFRLKSGRDTKPGCPTLWHTAVVSWDGKMGLCCIDYDCEYSPGNVFEQGFFNVWFGEKMQSYRQDVLVDKERISICSRCHRI